MFSAQLIIDEISHSYPIHLLIICREIFVLFGMTEMVVIFTIFQALGISTNNRTEDIDTIKFRLRRDVSLAEEDCSQLILLLEFIMF